MRKYLCAFAFVILAGGLFGSSVFADDNLVRFKGGIGVSPVSNVVMDATTTPITVTVNRNVVRGVNPPGQIWVIKDLDARVKTNGDIKVKGKGLILGGGNNVGRATGQSVFATLICEAAAPFTEHSTTVTGVPLAANGDFEIDDVLTPLPSGACASPMLLIRTTNTDPTLRNWFAAGIPDLGGKKED
jgi:hypothetical protein